MIRRSLMGIAAAAMLAVAVPSYAQTAMTEVTASVGQSIRGTSAWFSYLDWQVIACHKGGKELTLDAHSPSTTHIIRVVAGDYVWIPPSNDPPIVFKVKEIEGCIGAFLVPTQR